LNAGSISKWATHMSTKFFRICPLVVLMTFHRGSYAASTHEQDQFSLILQQLDTIERLATRAETANTAESVERYRFDYPRLSQDIQRIRHGVQGYLSPSRAQPRDPSELVGDYRLDTPPTEPSP
jgi:RAQPRD family integrative conjugative element protein